MTDEQELTNETPTVDEAEDLQEKKNELIEEMQAEQEPELSEDEIEKRKQAIKEGLVGSAEEKLDGEAHSEQEKNMRQNTEATEPSTEDAFQRGGVAIAGPFARRRVKPRVDKAQPATPTGARRGVQKIWEDRPINNVGGGKTANNVQEERTKKDDQ